jgi:acyl transferase domain-containing protein
MSYTLAAQDSVAIIGFDGIFPGAADVETFWDNLKEGREPLSKVSDDELRSLGVPLDLIRNPNAVRKTMALEGVDLFDAEFFRYTPAQACAIDPQQRLFLELAWHSLEHAGYDIDRYEGLIGVFAGASKNTYGWNGGAESPDIQAEIDSGLGSIANRVSYKLNLRGPSLAVHTACSTSLVAVHLACQSLLNFECDIALAGGASISLPQVGYIYQKNGILSPDGHCRAYDANARGTVPGNGLGIVVLKRLADAIADRDKIFAVVRGSAINNDGSQKVGYTAPSVEAQIAVMSAALAIADVRPRTIGLVEGHGTGTVVGDAIELTALTEVFSADPGNPRSCALGSIKANIGHLDVAAGVSGVIKATLCLMLHRPACG